MSILSLNNALFPDPIEEGAFPVLSSAHGAEGVLANERTGVDGAYAYEVRPMTPEQQARRPGCSFDLELLSQK